MSKPEQQSKQLWTIDWAATGFQHSDALFVLAPTPEKACVKAKKYLKSQGYVRVVIKGVKHNGEIDVF